MMNEIVSIYKPYSDAFHNLACEEYFLKEQEKDVMMIWSSEPSVVVGKHQNTYAEINYPYVKKNSIPVVRRLSGGGTVYHDKGNVNFCFIQKGEHANLVDFKKFTKPVIDFLTDLGVEAKFEGKNDLRVNGLKISGNAEHVFKNKVLHHGTLLFNSNLEKLGEAIRPGKGKITDKAVQSVRSQVTNIRSYLSQEMDYEDFTRRLFDFLALRLNAEEKSLTEEEKRRIDLFVREKYESWDWNYAYGPAFVFEKEGVFGAIEYSVKLEIKSGVIGYAECNFNVSEIDNKWLNYKLTGVKYNDEEIVNVLKQIRALGELGADYLKMCWSMFF